MNQCLLLVLPSDQKKPYSIEDGKIFKIINHKIPPMNIGGLWFISGGRSISGVIARMLPVKTRRIVGIILLSGGIILCMPFVLVLMNVLDDSDAIVLIWLILLIIGIISMVNSMHFFRKFEDRGALEDALFHSSFWSDDWDITEVQGDMKQQIDCSSCNQKLNIPFSYSGKISCPACGINMELEEGIIQAEGKFPISDQQ